MCYIIKSIFLTGLSSIGLSAITVKMGEALCRWKKVAFSHWCPFPILASCMLPNYMIECYFVLTSLMKMFQTCSLCAVLKKCYVFSLSILYSIFSKLFKGTSLCILVATSDFFVFYHTWPQIAHSSISNVGGKLRNWLFPHFLIVQVETQVQ